MVGIFYGCQIKEIKDSDNFFEPQKYQKNTKEIYKSLFKLHLCEFNWLEIGIGPQQKVHLDTNKIGKLRKMKNILYLIFVTLLFSNCLTLNGQLEEDADLETLGKWTVTGNKLTEVRKQTVENNSLYVENIATYWKQIYEVLPKEMMDKYVKELELITDGKEETLAGVKATDESNTHWNFGIDPADLPKGKITANQDFMHTLIHEFGHVLTLNNTQIEPSEADYQVGEDRYLTMEGLAFKESYINQFVQEFWYKEDRIEIWDEIQNIQNERKRIDRITLFYLNNKNAFFTAYAAESPEEDIAESWTFFILKDRPHNDKTELHKKLLFFYRFEELVAMRSEILATKF